MKGELHHHAAACATGLVNRMLGHLQTVVWIAFTHPPEIHVSQLYRVTMTP